MTSALNLLGHILVIFLFIFYLEVKEFYIHLKKDIKVPNKAKAHLGTAS